MPTSLLLPNAAAGMQHGVAANVVVTVNGATGMDKSVAANVAVAAAAVPVVAAVVGAASVFMA